MSETPPGNAPKPPKPVTAAKVRAVLRKAGFTKAEFHRSGQVRGWGNWSPGYRVRAKGDHVWVDHMDNRREYDTASHTRYRDTLTAAGIACELTDSGVRVPLGGEGETTS